MEQKKVDIEYIAKVAGVSRSTVSRVLTNKSNVKKDTKLRVQEVMRELNYHPSIMARGLATGKLNIVALIVSDIRNPFYSELVWSINDHLRQKGYLMTLYNSSQNTGENDRHLQSLFDYGFSGIIIADARNEASFTELLGQSNCPIVLVNRELTLASGTSYDTVSVDNRQEDTWQPCTSLSWAIGKSVCSEVLRYPPPARPGMKDTCKPCQNMA